MKPVFSTAYISGVRCHHYKALKYWPDSEAVSRYLCLKNLSCLPLSYSELFDGSPIFCYSLEALQTIKTNFSNFSLTKEGYYCPDL